MKKNNWSDEQLKSLLGQFPSIKDERDPNVIYQKIEAGKTKYRPRRPWLMPAVATVFALMLCIVIGESFFRSNNSNYSLSDSSKMEKSEYIAISEDRDNMENSSSYQMKGQADDIQKQQTSNPLITEAVYQEDVGNKELLTYPIPDNNVQVAVPVSILVDNPENLTKFDLYKKYMDVINENAWGLKNYYPFNGNIVYDTENETVIIDFLDDISSLGSFGSDNFLNSIVYQQLESIGAKKMEFKQNGQNGVVVGNRELNEMVYHPLENRGYFLLSDSKDNETALYVPWEAPYRDIETAISNMSKDIPDYGLSASIPENISFDKIIKNTDENELVLHFSNDSSLAEDKHTVRAIETILLTAKDFEFKTVKFENAKLEQIGKFVMNEDITVPVAANKKEIAE